MSHTEHNNHTTDLISDTYKLLKDGKPVGMDHGHQNDTIESIREDDYKGHHIKIQTSYKITIDNKPIKGHITVDNKGRLHTHAMPTYMFNSAVDMIKKLIDNCPSDFPDVQKKN